ncbi:MAG TPA: protein-methionine-sulfoxide reductase catalytic subunit MsrP, partial [Burkholderiaceae bacterium]
MNFLRDRGFVHPLSSEITPRSAYAERRAMLKLLGTGVAGAALAGWAARD